jgi:hypothetical protein
MVPTLGRPVFATPGRAFIPDVFLRLASSMQHLVFIGIDYFSTSALTASPTSSLCTPSSGQTRATPCPWRLRLHRLRHRHPSMMTASTRLRHSFRALCARGFLCGYLDTGSPPRHRPRHPLAGYLEHAALQGLEFDIWLSQFVLKLLLPLVFSV